MEGLIFRILRYFSFPKQFEPVDAPFLPVK